MIALSEHNKTVLRNNIFFGEFGIKNNREPYIKVYNHMLSHPQSAILYMKHEEHHIRFIAECIATGTDI